MSHNKNKRLESVELRPYKAKFALGTTIQCETLGELERMINAHLARAKKNGRNDSLIEKTTAQMAAEKIAEATGSHVASIRRMIRQGVQMTPEKIAETTGYHVASIRRMIRQGVQMTPEKIAALRARKLAREKALVRIVPVPNGAEWLFLDQAASLLKISTQTIGRMVKRGQLHMDKDRARRNQPSINAAIAHQHARAKRAGKR